MSATEYFKTGADTNYLPDGQEAVDTHSAVDTLAPVCSPDVYNTGSLPGGIVHGNSVPITSDLDSASQKQQITRKHEKGQKTKPRTCATTCYLERQDK